MIRCWPVFNKAPAGAHHVHHARRIGRAIKRAAAGVVSKPAIIGWTCITVGWPAAMGQSTLPPSNVAPSNFERHFAYFPQETIGNAGLFEIPSAIEFPIAGPPVLLPDVPLATEVPTTPGQPVPEPSSLALLVTALAGMGAAYRVLKVRCDAVKLPHGRLMRSQYSARRTARLLAVTNTDPAVDHFAVSDGTRIVFAAPSSGRGDHA